MPTSISPINVLGTTLNVDTTSNPTISGSNGVVGAYDLYGPAALQIIGTGTLSIQDPALGDTLVGVLTVGTTDKPLFWIKSGTVTVDAQGASDTAYGFYSSNENVGFENDGTFSVSSTLKAYAVAVNAGGLLINTGTITATSSGSVSYGILAGDHISGGVTTIQNSGTITAQYAVDAYSGAGYIALTNTASGTLNGDVLLGTAAGNSVVNAGSINGNVIFLGTSGQQLYDGRGGTLSVSHSISFAPTNATGTDIAYLGNDGETVQGGAAVLYVYGGSGADHISGGSGASFIDGGAGDDVLNGGSGLATVAYGSATSGVTVSLALQGSSQNTIGAGNDTLTNFQNIIGSAYSDHLTGDANNNSIDGGKGGNDVLDGGGGVNTALFASALQGVTVSLALQGAAQNTGVGSDTLTNFQNLTGSAYNDILEGNAGNNVLDGWTGTNTVSYAHATAGVTVSLELQGQAQNTQGAGTDTLYNFQAILGSAYNDTLEGGGASSTLTGGAGADTFVYRSGDGNVTIADFSATQGDVIDLSGLTSFYSLSSVLAQASQVGSDTVITIGAGSLRLQGVAETSLTVADFHLAPPPGSGGSPTTVTGTSANHYTATFQGVLQQYTVGFGAGTDTVLGQNTNDVLANVQRIQFVDGYLAVSPTDTAGQVYRLYEATLGRAPDQAGLTSWVNSLNSGTSLQSVANGFVGSQEFQAVYGANLSNSDFVTLLYSNVLQRAPDQAGLTNWVNLLTSGQDTRAQVVVGFSESPEYINASTAAVSQGLWVANPVAAEVARMYDTVFGRLPDASGLANWTNSLQGGMSLQTAANGFVGSQEFQSVYGNLNNNDFVTLLYNNVLHRAPDQAGLTNWVNYLTTGAMTRAQVVIGFSESPEHITNAAPHIDSGIWVAG